MQANKQVLIIGPAWIGDMVMSQSLFQMLKNQDPNIEIDVVAPEWSRPILERMPEVRRSFSLEISHGQIKVLKRLQLARQIRAQKYTQAIILPNSYKSALIPFLAGIPQRTGWRGEWRYGLINDMRFLEKKTYALMIEQFMALGLPAGSKLNKPYPIPKLNVNLNSQQKALAKYNLRTDHKPVLALCPGAEYGIAKRWPVEYFTQLAGLALKDGWQVWLFGSKNDVCITKSIQKTLNYECIDLTGQTSLAEAIDLLACVTAAVTNDSGLMHIAAAVARPQVVIYGSTSPRFTPPLSKRVKLIQKQLNCQPCFKRKCPLNHLQCLYDIKPLEIYHAVGELVKHEGTYC